ncbi:uncharacterized protein LOC127080738 [Lathyrus oleraceus]|uniref:uncharacterized protein LOC127080738 n=1 Tax=Pisum sativum TaxID=3888 RepID=UPI0021D3CC08|nr:uncharacterized protein LOC127080738 [Pisum sativum]
MFNGPISLPSSTSSSPPYYTISSDSEPSDPQSPTLAQLQARALSTHHQSEPEANIPSPSGQPPTPPFEPPIETPSEKPIIHNSEPLAETTPTPPTPKSPIPEPEPNFPTLISTSDQRGRRQGQKRSRREGRLEEEKRAREATENVVAEDAAGDVGAEAKAKADAEEATHIAAEEDAKAINDAQTQGEQSHSDFAPLVLKTLEELQKEQQIVRARLD